jgi:cysteine synthase B
MSISSLEEKFVHELGDIYDAEHRFLEAQQQMVKQASDDSLRMTRELTRVEGIFAGFSCGAVLHVGLRIARRMERGNVVLLLADGGWKYLSSGLWTGSESDVADEVREKVMW